MMSRLVLTLSLQKTYSQLDFLANSKDKIKILNYKIRLSTPKEGKIKSKP